MPPPPQNDYDYLKAKLPAPLIIPRDRHNISRKKIDDDALRVLYRLHKKGFIAYLVGGSVRDLLLERPPHDFDICTSATPEQVRRLFRNSRIIGRRFKLAQVFFSGNKIIEVSTFRSLSEATREESLVEDNEYGSPAEDAWRRDLTINALFYNIADFSVVDYVGGMADLEKGLIRAVGEADLRFHQDPVRILRALRHAARTGFNLTPETMRAVMNRKTELDVCPESRIRDELLRDITGGAYSNWLELARESGVLFVLFPALAEFYANAGRTFARARELAGRLDAAKYKEDFLGLAALVWPILEAGICCREMGRADWMIAVRDELARLISPCNFTRRMVDRLCRAATPLYYLYGVFPRLPHRLGQKAYFEDSCLLANFLGFDLAALAGVAPKLPRRRARSKRKKNVSANFPALASGTIVS